MRVPLSIKSRIKNAVRIDRAFVLVWKASPSLTVCALLSNSVQGLLPLAGLYVTKLIIDAAATAVQTGTGEAAFSSILFLIALAVLVAVIQAAFHKLSHFISEAQSLTVTDYVYTTLHEKSVGLDLAYYENHDYFNTLHRAQKEGPYRPTRIVGGLARLVQNGVSLMAMVGLLFMFHWSVGMLLFVSTLPGIIVQIIYARKRFEWQTRRTKDERRAAYINAVLTFPDFAKEIRLFDSGSYFISLFETVRKVIRKEKLELGRGNAIADFWAQFFAAVVLMGCFALIVFRTLKGRITIGDMVMYFQAFQRGINYLKTFLTSIASLYEDNMFVSHYYEFLNIQNRIIRPLEPKPVPETFQQGIRFEQLCFGYPDGRDWVLQDMSLTIKAGEVVALVGSNGSGKSTLVKLLCRLYDPDRGTITIDGIPLTETDPRELRKRISVVFQDFVRYHLSVIENIWVGNTAGPLDLAKIKKAARRAGASSFIERLTRQYETELGRWLSSGEELSGGEWQRIALARAFHRDAQLVILDEPTSSLDVHAEYYLFNRFRELVAGKTALLISHRFSTVRMADRIFVMEDGRIAESGSHRELMALAGIYADMYQKQAAWLDR